MKLELVVVNEVVCTPTPSLLLLCSIESEGLAFSTAVFRVSYASLVSKYLAIEARQGERWQVHIQM